MTWDEEFDMRWKCKEDRHPVVDELVKVHGEWTVSVCLCGCGVRTTVFTTASGEVVSVGHVPYASNELQRGGSFYTIMSKYLKAAVARAEGTDKLTEGLDPILFKDRPALEEFMTLLRTDDGKARDASCLMLALRAGGIGVGLKDESAGWCWREGRNLAMALNALEKALQDGTAVFAPPGGKNARGRGARG